MAEILAMVSILMMPKNITSNISTHLTHKEFKCRCSRVTCHYTLVNGDLVASFETLRDIIGKPLHINSGYRCAFHNASIEVGGKATSNHTRGAALDISTKGLTTKEKAALVYHANDLFDYVKEYLQAEFIHVQINE